MHRRRLCFRYQVPAQQAEAVFFKPSLRIGAVSLKVSGLPIDVGLGEMWG
jgi:hypothetical protein